MSCIQSNVSDAHWMRKSQFYSKIFCLSGPVRVYFLIPDKVFQLTL